MTWDYHVGRTDNGNHIVDAGDKFYQNVPLADFALSLIKDGRAIATSDSLYDNVELLSYKISASGNYSLAVYRHGTGGNRNETFAVAAHVLNNPPALRSLDEPNLALASASSGVSRSLEISAVPEPATPLVLGIIAAISCCSRRRPSKGAR
jgi:hypothetical protein